jgi:hypothetical protein
LTSQKYKNCRKVIETGLSQFVENQKRFICRERRHLACIERGGAKREVSAELNFKNNETFQRSVERCAGKMPALQKNFF